MHESKEYCSQVSTALNQKLETQFSISKIHKAAAFQQNEHLDGSMFKPIYANTWLVQLVYLTGSGNLFRLPLHYCQYMTCSTCQHYVRNLVQTDCQFINKSSTSYQRWLLGQKLLPTPPSTLLRAQKLDKKKSQNMGYKRYHSDIFLLTASDAEGVYLMQFNPFASCTSPPLSDGKNDFPAGVAGLNSIMGLPHLQRKKQA